MLIGDKVILEEIDPANIEQLRQWRNNPELRQWFRECKDITKDRQEVWYKDRGNNTNQEHVYFQIMSLGAEDDPSIGQPYKRTMEQRIENRYLIGCCGLHYIDFRLRKAEFGIFIAKDRGQGKGKETLKMLFNYGFDELNLHKIWAEVYESNESIKLYRKFLKEDGVLRDNSFHNGKYSNSTMMSVLEDEWKITKEQI
jgi:RimJ/RimL family protein N-acetyltransferase